MRVLKLKLLPVPRDIAFEHDQSWMLIVVLGALLISGCRDVKTATPPPDDDYTQALVDQTLNRLDSGDPEWSRDVREIAVTFAHYDDFANAISSCTKIVVYEGLPHPTWESDLLSSEVRSNETIVLGNFHFYASPIAISARDARQICELYCSRGSFYPFQGFKDCGGFHPDWCVVWQTKETTYEVQFCFGCCEMKTTDGSNFLRCDMGNKRRKQFEAILSRYRSKRPPC